MGNFKKKLVMLSACIMGIGALSSCEEFKSDEYIEDAIKIVGYYEFSFRFVSGQIMVPTSVAVRHRDDNAKYETIPIRWEYDETQWSSTPIESSEMIYLVPIFPSEGSIEFSVTAVAVHRRAEAKKEFKGTLRARTTSQSIEDTMNLGIILFS